MGLRWLSLLLCLAPALTGAEVRRDYVDGGSGQLHIRISGDMGKATRDRPALVLLHQVPNSSQVFESFMPQMAKRGPVIAFDLPGFGMSDPVADTIEAYAEAILAGLDYLSVDRIDLLGYHTGAAVAAEMIRKKPQLVRRLVLAAVPILTSDERQRFAALPPIPFDPSGDFARTEFQRSMKWRGPGQTVDSVKRTFAEKMRPGARERGATAVVAYDLAAVLPQIARPTLVLRPRDDLWEATLRARPLLPDAEWVDLPDYGHGLFEVASELLAELIGDFLD
ncbi:MAG: alpha/beta hydrolase [Xanthomonadales bacterium]|nr:alpha/beta hydrolase [Xanthomonadales bacterium]